MPAKLVRKKTAHEQATIAKAIAEAPPSADSCGLLRAIMHEFGGEAELARAVVLEYRKAGEGSQTRQRLLEMIQRLIIMNTQHELGRNVEPSQMSDEDLETVASRLLAKVSHAVAAGANAKP